jgi:hypothetical protein
MAKTGKLTEREVSTHSQRYALIQLTAACAHSLLSVSSMFLFRGCFVVFQAGRSKKMK